MWPTQAWVVLLAGALILGGLVGGMVAGWRRTPALRGWLPVLVLPPAGIMAQAVFTGSVLYPWYIMIGVPGMMLALAIGLEAGATRLTRSAFGQTIVVASGIALWALIGAPVRHTLRHHPIEPNREAAWLVQPVINPYHLDYQKTVITAGFLMQNSIYDPGLREFKTVEELRALMEEAGRTGRDVAVTYGQPQLGRLVYPEIMAVLDDPAVFRPVAVLPGQEAYCTRYIVRHTPAAAR
jgi:predicted membrane-bound spermidine synthase